MKKDTLKKLFVIVVLLLFYVVSIRAAYGDVITEQITIKLEKAGELGGKIDVTTQHPPIAIISY